MEKVTEVAGWAVRFDDGCGQVDEIRIFPLAILYSVDRDGRGRTRSASGC